MTKDTGRKSGEHDAMGRKHFTKEEVVDKGKCSMRSQ